MLDADSHVNSTDPTDEAPPLTRNELYLRAWSEPMDGLAGRYGYSGRGLAKLCAGLKIPVPARGYWAKRRAGKKVTQPKLPALEETAHGASGVVLRGPVTVESPPVPAAVSLQIEHEKAATNSISVAVSLADAKPWHSLVARYKSPRRPTSGGRVGAPNDPNELSLDIRVSPAAEDRALCILDALFKALDERGYPVECRMPRRQLCSNGYSKNVTDWPGRWHNRATCVQVGDQDVLLTLREYDKQIKPEAAAVSSVSGSRRTRAAHAEPVIQMFDRPRPHLVPSGRLTLVIPHHVGGWGNYATWSDSRGVGSIGRLESQLNDVIVGVVATAEEYRRVIALWQDRLRESKEKERQASERARESAREAALAKEIERQATAWKLAATIREYLAEIASRPDGSDAEHAAVLKELCPQGMSQREWVSWAQSYADDLDPLKRPL